jgi:hypothetical protein
MKKPLSQRGGVGVGYFQMKYVLYFLMFSALLSCEKGSSSADSISPGSGTGGSTARFTVANNALYVVTNTSLQAYDISRSDNPRIGSKTNIGIGVETIFPYKNNLFVGTQTGMYIFDLGIPDQPRRLSVYNHFQSCDPVVAQGNYAYVTLRGGTTCRNTSLNTLDVIDISNLSQPKVIASYPMKNPHGLGIDGTVLFVTEGDYGLRVLDITNPLLIKQTQFFEDIKAYDVIPTQKRLLVTGPDGIYQYSYADPTKLQLLSKISVEP